MKRRNHITLYLPETLLTEIQDIAKAEERSRNSVIVDALKAFIEQQERVVTEDGEEISYEDFMKA